LNFDQQLSSTAPRVVVGVADGVVEGFVGRGHYRLGQSAPMPAVCSQPCSCSRAARASGVGGVGGLSRW